MKSLLVTGLALFCLAAVVSAVVLGRELRRTTDLIARNERMTDNLRGQEERHLAETAALQKQLRQAKDAQDKLALEKDDLAAKLKNAEGALQPLQLRGDGRTRATTQRCCQAGQERTHLCHDSLLQWLRRRRHGTMLCRLMAQYTGCSMKNLVPPVNHPKPQ